MMKVDSKTFWQILQPHKDCVLTINKGENHPKEKVVAYFMGIPVVIDNSVLNEPI